MRHRRKIAKRRRRQPEHPYGPVNVCTALVPVDGTRIRNKWTGDCKRARTYYERAQREWTFFDHEELPAYTRWIRHHCGALMTRVADTHRKLDYNSFVVNLTYAEQYRTRAPLAVCYERVMHRLEHPEDHEAESNDASTGEPLDDEDEWEAFESEMEDFVRNMFGQGDHDPLYEPVDGADHGQIHAAAGIKEKYRQLCRRLHPDANGEMSPTQKELWFRVQEAYAADDHDLLDMLIAECDLHDGAFSPSTPVAHIRHLTRQFRSSLRALRATIRRARQQPEWGFLSWDENMQDRHLRGLRSEIRMELDYLEEQNSYCENMIEGWKRTAARPRRTKKAAQRRPQPAPAHDPQEVFDFF